MITREKVKAHLKRHKMKRSICKLCAVVHDVALKRAGWVFSYE